MERSKLRILRGLVNISLISLVFGAILNLLTDILGNYYVLAIGFLVVLITFIATAGPIAKRRRV